MASAYAKHAAVPDEIGKRLLEHLDPVRIAPAWILDAGARTGALSSALTKRYPRARVLSLDTTPAMLLAARRRGPRWRARAHQVCAHAEQLPIQAQSVDLVIANLLSLLVAEPDKVFSQFAAALRPAGLLMFSALGPDTLKELRECLGTSADADRFIDMHDLGDALVRAGFTDVVMETERITVFYPDLDALWRELRALSVGVPSATNHRALRTPRWLSELERDYESRRVDAGLPATCEVVYAHAWAPVPRELAVTFEAQ